MRVIKIIRVTRARTSKDYQALYQNYKRYYIIWDMGVIILTSIVRSTRVIMLRLWKLEMGSSKVITIIRDIRDTCLQFYLSFFLSFFFFFFFLYLLSFFLFQGYYDQCYQSWLWLRKAALRGTVAAHVCQSFEGRCCEGITGAVALYCAHNGVYRTHLSRQSAIIDCETSHMTVIQF